MIIFKLYRGGIIKLPKLILLLINKKLFELSRRIVKICRMVLSRVYRSVGISLGVLDIVSEVFEIYSNYTFSPFNILIIIFNILWVCGICVEDATLLLPLVIADGFFLCFLSFYCFPLWLLTTFEESSNIWEDSFLEEFNISIVVNVLTILSLLFLFIFKCCVYKATNQLTFEYEYTYTYSV